MLIKLSLALVLGVLVAFIFMGNHWPVLLVLIGASPCLCFKKSRSFALVFCFGLGLFFFSAQLALQRSLPAELDKHTALISIKLADLPQVGSQSAAGKLTVVLNQAVVIEGFTLAAASRIRISDYANLNIKPGENWQLQAVLRSPRGLVNAGGFDFRRWLLSERIVATAYVVSSENNYLQKIEPFSWLVQRYQMAERIDTVLADRPSRALIKALVLGDTSALSTAHREVFQRTGIAHLFVISGLHIGLIAALAWLLGRGVCIFLLHPLQHGYALRIQALCSLLAAMSYAALAGLSLPTMRAVLMVALVLLAVFYRRHYRPVHVLLVVAAAIILSDPLVILGMSFWMSFTAVVVLLYAWRSERRWQALLLGQLCIFLAMNILLSVFDMPIAPLSPLINLVAIPLVSFVLVPLSLGATALLMLDIETPLLWLQIGFDGVWELLLSLSKFEYAQWVLSPSLPFVILAVVGLYIGFRYRQFWYIAVLTQLPIYSFIPSNNEALEIIVFDVGQGLSVLVKQGSYSLLYDTGAAYPSGFSMAEAVVAPSLHRLGVRKLNTLVVSHGDNDHAGGAELISEKFTPSNHFAPASFRSNAVAYQNCAKAKTISHDQLTIEFLNASLVGASENNNSCLLRFSFGGFTVLFSGDIEKLAEFTLVNRGLLGADIVMVPHHGSRSSSSEAFLDAVKPSLAIVSAGFNNRFNHPHTEVSLRYQRRSVPLLNTATTGAVSLRITEAGGLESIRLARVEKFGFWHE